MPEKKASASTDPRMPVDLLEVDRQQDEMIREIARRYADALQKEFDLLGLYVYGSYAKGTQRADSDIDIAVVADAFTGDTVEDTWHLMKLRRGVDIRIEPHPFLPSDFTEANPAALEVMRTGIRIV